MGAHKLQFQKNGYFIRVVTKTRRCESMIHCIFYQTCDVSSIRFLIYRVLYLCTALSMPIVLKRASRAHVMPL